MESGLGDPGGSFLAGNSLSKSMGEKRMGPSWSKARFALAWAKPVGSLDPNLPRLSKLSCWLRAARRYACSLDPGLHGWSELHHYSFFWNEDFNASLDIDSLTLPLHDQHGEMKMKHVWLDMLHWLFGTSVYWLWFGRMRVKLSQLLPNTFHTPRAHQMRHHWLILHTYSVGNMYDTQGQPLTYDWFILLPWLAILYLLLDIPCTLYP